MEGSPLVYMMFLLYYRSKFHKKKVSCDDNRVNSSAFILIAGECKGTINWGLLGVSSGVAPQLPDESEATARTFIFSVVYLCLYAALIFTALLSLIGINNSCLGRRSFPIFFAPWIFVAIAVLVMDVLATVYYVTDTVRVTVSSFFTSFDESVHLRFIFRASTVSWSCWRSAIPMQFEVSSNRSPPTFDSCLQC